MFGLSQHELNIIHYSGMALVKLCVILFFFIPWLSIRMVLRGAGGLKEKVGPQLPARGL
jgi:hypothetical protein